MNSLSPPSTFFKVKSNKSIAWFYDLQLKNDLPTSTEKRHTLAFLHASRKVKNMTPNQLSTEANLK